jgi:hypothetical protein
VVKEAWAAVGSLDDYNTAYPGLLTIGLLASPGLELLLAGLLVEEEDGQR